MPAKNLGGSGVLYTDRRNFYLSPNVTKELWTSVAPFTTIIANRPIVTGLADPLFKMFEHRDPWIKQQVAVNDSSPPNILDDDTGTVVTVDSIVGLASPVDSSYVNLVFEIYDSTLVTKRGTVVCTAISGADLTVKPLYAAAIQTADNDVLLCRGNAQGEGSSAPEAWGDELRVVWGSTQIMETPVDITGTLLRAALRGYSNELARLRMMKNKEFKMQRENGHLFGESIIGTNLDVDAADTFSDAFRTDANGKKIRTSMGLVTAIERYGKTSGDTQNRFTITAASYNYGNFVDDMEKVFQYYPEDGIKYALCGPGAMSYWSKISTSGFADNSGWKVQLSDSFKDKLGFAIRMLETPHGILALVLTPALRGPRNKSMLVISDSNLNIVEYEPPMYKTNIKTDNAYKGVKDVYFSDEGLGMTLIESHHIFNVV
jgi:hypothetical protein